MKAVIYARTSTKEQHPEKQLEDCRQFCKARGYEIVDEYIEKASGYKMDTKRPQYDLIKSRAFRGEINAVVVWALDRWVRNRDSILEDVTTLRTYGCKLHSVREEWLEAINIDGALGKTIQDFLLGMVGSLAEMESERKSERTRLAFQNRTGRWGRKPLPHNVVKEIIRHRCEGRTMRWIADNVSYYDKNRNSRKVGVATVHKIITQNDV